MNAFKFIKISHSIAPEMNEIKQKYYDPESCWTSRSGEGIL
ncbi:hypothetical protein yfred0001_34260 [Yersinia frederiksenii ATCC 33641]|nr:hypothetical protein yfred0001_34260 [Yersinia frederiksenii ATCC 33641]